MPYRFVESPHATRVADRPIDTIVIHTMEIDEIPDAAARCAAWFANPRSKVSAHYCVDADTVIQSVAEADVAWHARGGNGRSIGVELAGSARQTRSEWADAYSLAVLDRAADLVADVAARHAVPVRRIGPVGLQAGERGITGHADVSQAFRKSDHWDPGPSFPWVLFLRRVRIAQGPSAQWPSSSRV